MVYTIRKVTEGKVTEAEMVIVEAKEQTKWHAPKKPTTAAAVENLKALVTADGFRMKMDPNGVDPKKWDEMGPRARQIAAAIAEASFPAYPADNVMLLPEKPVAEGATWKPDTKVLDQWIAANPETKNVQAKVTRCEMKLANVAKGVATVAGDIEVQMTVASRTFKVPMDVEADIDLSSGRWVAVRKKGTMDMDMGGAKVTGEMNSRRTMRLNPEKRPRTGDDSGKPDKDKDKDEGKGPNKDKAETAAKPRKDKPARTVDLRFRSSVKGDVLWGGEPISTQHQGGAKLVDVPSDKAVSLSFYPADSKKAELVSLDLRKVDGDPMYAWFVAGSAAKTVKGMGALPEDDELTADQKIQAGRLAAMLDALRRIGELAGHAPVQTKGEAQMVKGSYVIAGMPMSFRGSMTGRTPSLTVSVVLPTGPDGKPITLTVKNYLLEKPASLGNWDGVSALSAQLAGEGIKTVKAEVLNGGFTKAEYKLSGAVIYRLK